MKRKAERAALEWDDFLLQEQLKSLMYVDRSLRGYPKKDKFIDELNNRNCMSFKIIKTSKVFVGITDKKRKFIIHAEYSDANNISSHTFIHNPKN